MSVKPVRPSLSRRSIIAATAGLASGAAWSNCALAQADSLPDAASGLHGIMPTPAPALAFTDAKGKKLTLADFRGHGLVVNLWATWCGPCVAELPSLDAVAPHLASSQILVLPISVDLTGAHAVAPFYAAHHIDGLPMLLDPSGGILDTLHTDGIPVTIIINPAGQLVARLEGAADWSTAATIRAVRRLTSSSNQGGVMPV